MARQIKCVDTKEEVRSYKEYLKTKHWRDIKKKYNKKYKYECSCCGSSDKGLHLHHITYERVGNEQLEDLVYLCKDCHSKIHSIINETKDTSMLQELRRKRKSKKLGGKGSCKRCIHNSRKGCDVGYDIVSRVHYCRRFAENDYILSKEEVKQIKNKNKDYKKPDGVGKISNGTISSNSLLMKKKALCR